MRILVAGGAGYIGSHTCIELLGAGHEVIVIDNLYNSSVEALRRVEQITGQSIQFYQADIRDASALHTVFSGHQIDAVINFAGLKAVGESVAKPLAYYDNNVAGAVTLAQVMAEHDVRSLVFSSSATVYGDPSTLPITEDFPLSATNPYGRSKLIVEDILRDLYASNKSWKIGLLRYFNPVGAHSSGLIGEDPNDIPNNLMPFISQVAVGKLARLRVFGNDYDTEDGTGVRDYIHVVDLAKGHVKALEALAADDAGRLLTINLGTGQGYSVLDMVKAFAKGSGVDIPYEIVDRRPGDIAACYADPGYALEAIDWKAELDVEAMCADTWRWQSLNPNGYKAS